MSPDQMQVVVKSIKAETPEIQTYELVSPDGHALPTFSAGSHVDVHLENGLVRQYSLCNDPHETQRYLIGVLKDPASRGGIRLASRERCLWHAADHQHAQESLSACDCRAASHPDRRRHWRDAASVYGRATEQGRSKLRDALLHEKSGTYGLSRSHTVVGFWSNRVFFPLGRRTGTRWPGSAKVHDQSRCGRSRLFLRSSRLHGLDSGDAEDRRLA